MTYLKTYKDFVNGRYLTEGLRITAGILLPAFVMSYFNLLATGIVMSVGALCVSATDTPGPVRHRVNGMLFCNIVITIVSIIVCSIAGSVYVLGALILVFGFLFSMLTVYGTRTSAVGIAALLIMILSLQTPVHGINIFKNALHILIGGTWYMMFSLLLYKIRPYKLIQQILGDFIQSIGEYLRIRGSLYDTDPDYESINELLFKQQAIVQTQQNLVSEVLFKTREIVKESTHKGRVLLKTYLDVADLFESVMTTYQHYQILHKQFDITGILQKFKDQIYLLSEELSGIGTAIKSGEISYAKPQHLENIKLLREQFEGLRVTFMTDENVDDFISLGRIVNNLDDLTGKIKALHFYTTYDKKISKENEGKTDYSIYTDSQDIRPALFLNNLNFKSNIFRHSLRVAFALLLGFIISLFFHLGHSYWILLTIVVILKPAYSLTKTRNRDRLIGTFFGILIGVAVLLVVKNNTALLVLMILFMAISYMFMRTNYLLNVLLMTPYLVIFFHLLKPGDLRVLLSDRIIDTAIGSAIAFVASIFFVPLWEHVTIKRNMVQMLGANNRYYKMIAESFGSNAPVNIAEIKKARKEVLIALANLSDAFTRMLSEPKRFQKSAESIHHFVVLNHSFTSHLSTLSYYLIVRKNPFRSQDVFSVIKYTERNLSDSINYLEKKTEVTKASEKDSLQNLNKNAEMLLEKRKEEILNGELETETKKLLVQVKSVVDQFNFIYSVSSEIFKSCKEIN